MRFGSERGGRSGPRTLEIVQLPGEPRLTCSLDRLHPDVSVSVSLGMIPSPAGVTADLPSLVRWARADMHRVEGGVSGPARRDSPADARRRRD